MPRILEIPEEAEPELDETDVPARKGWLYRYLLVLRFALINIVALGITGAVYLQGWLDGALEGETRWLTLGITAVFVYGMAVCSAKIWRTSRELNEVNIARPPARSRAAAYLDAIRGKPPESRSMSANLLRLRMSSQISIVRHVANTLVLLGLIGTVIGFILALSGVKPEATTQVEQVAPMVGTLIKGMSIALYTTLVGAVLHVWLMVNHRMLSTGTVELFDAIVALGEQRVGS
ncbi:MAG: MotA/TolQ/ExbB proton channel family protein [Gammaproteobacteria bacterium]|nr:MotA/TolQ/ExbB proton channel family protein [Gammaproteobacteria bacterium]